MGTHACVVYALHEWGACQIQMHNGKRMSHLYTRECTHGNLCMFAILYIHKPTCACCKCIRLASIYIYL